MTSAESMCTLGGEQGALCVLWGAGRRANSRHFFWLERVHYCLMSFAWRFSSEFGTDFTHVCDLLENPHWDFIALPSQGFIHLQTPQCAARRSSQKISSVFAVDRALQTPMDPKPASPLLLSCELTCSAASKLLIPSSINWAILSPLLTGNARVE